MGDQLHFRVLTSNDLGQMHRSFIEAFSTYKVEMKMSREAFEDRMLDKLHIDFNISPGVFSGDKLVGFIFQTINNYEGQQSAYNGGTGVIPGYLGQNLTYRMYEFILPTLRSKGVKKCVLEVLEDNISAIKAYRKSGFEKTKDFQCLMLKEGILSRKGNISFQMKVVSDFDINRFLPIGEIESSMLDQLSQVKYHLNKEMILECLDDDHLIGYIVFQPHNGRIAQLAVKKEYRLQGIGTALVSKAHQLSESKTLSVLNIETEQRGLIQFFEKMGFTCDLTQFEMQRLI